MCLEGLVVIMNAIVAYGLISYNSDRVGCDHVAHVDLRNDIEELPNSSSGVVVILLIMLLMVIEAGLTTQWSLECSR